VARAINGVIYTLFVRRLVPGSVGYDATLSRWKDEFNSRRDRKLIPSLVMLGYHNLMYCLVCHGELIGKQKKFCSLECKNSKHQNYLYQKIRAKERKLQLIRDLGGKCSICGYKRNMAALLFHHRDGKTKRFKVDARTLANRASENVKKEIAKCSLLCSNCHLEIHHPDMGL
jgi:hypothetical protein